MYFFSYLYKTKWLAFNFLSCSAPLPGMQTQTL